MLPTIAVASPSSMAQEAASSNIVDLTEDDTFEQLRVAASRAHDAASRLSGHLEDLGSYSRESDYLDLTQLSLSPQIPAIQPNDTAKRLQEVQIDVKGSPSLHKHDAPISLEESHHVDLTQLSLSPQIPDMESKDTAERLPEVKRDIEGPVGLSRHDRATPSTTHATIIDSGLGESLSGSDSSMHWLSNLSHSSAMTPERPITCVSTERTPRTAALSAKRHFANTDWTAERLMSPEFSPPKAQAVTATPIKKGRPRKYHDDGSLVIRASRDLETPKKRGRPRRDASITTAFRSYTDPFANANNSLPSAKARLSPIQQRKRKFSGSYFDRSLSKAANESSGADAPLEVQRQYELSLNSGQEASLLDVFKNVIYPAIEGMMQRYQARLSQDQLIDISKSVFDAVVEPDSVISNHMAGSYYKPDSYQKKVITKFVEATFENRVLQTTHYLSSSSSSPAASVPGVSNTPLLKTEDFVSTYTIGRKDGTRGARSDLVSQKITTGDLNRFQDHVENPKPTMRLSDRSQRTISQTITSAKAIDPAEADDVQIIFSSELKRKEADKKRWKKPGYPITEPSVSRVSPMTAFDPHLEHLIAEVATNKPKVYLSCNQGERDSVTLADQNELLRSRDILKRVDHKAKKLVRVESKMIDPARRPERGISSLLRHRELGSDARGRNVETHRQLRLQMSEMIEPWKHWKGASGDIVAVAWGPDSTTYAVGAAAHTNDEDLQYNRPCNLLLGDLTSNLLKELPDHRVERPRPETIATGPNATRAVYDACDPMVYKTVSSIAFSLTGNLMYTASHDRTVKVWDVSAEQRGCLLTLPHHADVTSIESSAHIPGLFATASKSLKDSIRVYRSDNSEYSYQAYIPLTSSRAEARIDRQIYPECLRWGLAPYTSHLLLAGFQQWAEPDSNGPPRLGHLCLWDANAFEYITVSPSSQSVFAAAWHPVLPTFATGGAPGGGILTDKYSTKTVIRTWDFRSPGRYTVEYECSARDMQDITFSPLDSNIVTAGCTDGTSYVWDYRWPGDPLHRLRHDRPLVVWDHTKSRDEGDTGVMMSLWGLGGSLFYTGSSDGMIKAWDIRRHPEDVLIKNVAQLGVGIQSGAFSPDGTNLLVGDADGGIHILSSAPCGPRNGSDESERGGAEKAIELVRAHNGSGSRVDEIDGDNPGTEGIRAAHELIESGQLDYNPGLGVGKGPNYNGPYWKEAYNADTGKLRSRIARIQPFHKNGKKREEIIEKRLAFWEERKLHISHGEEEAPRLDKLNEPEPITDTSLLSPGEGSIPFHRPSLLSQDSRVLDPAEENDSLEGHKHCSLSMPAYRTFGNTKKRSGSVKASTPDSLHGAKDNTIPESKMVEENHWWPRFGEKEITKARAGRR